MQACQQKKIHENATVKLPGYLYSKIFIIFADITHSDTQYYYVLMDTFAAMHW